MASSDNQMASLAKRVNSAFIAPLIVGPNLGLAAINAVVGGTARIGAASAKAAEEAKFPLAGVVRDLSDKVAHSALSTANESLRAATAAVQNVAGGDQRSTKGSNRLLAQTFLDQGLRTGALPISVTVDSVTAAVEGPLRKQAEEAWLVINRWLDDLSIHGVIPGSLGTETNGDVRFGFYYMAAWGPQQAILRDVKGIVGGFLALGVGDFERLAEALPHYWESMEYVYDKKLHDEVEPESDFPIGATLAADAEATIQRFPWHFTHALQEGKPLDVLRATIRDFGMISTLVTRFPRVEFNVVYDVLVFIRKALVEAGDAQNYALCELAILESSLSNEDKERSLKMLRKTATNNTVEFEFYVPLLVPQDGTPADQVHRRDAAGEPIPDTAISNSVFRQEAIDRAQAINSELFSLRAFIWLYGDETVARRKNREQTVMKFGPEAADRIERNPVYPLSPEELATLTQAGPRPLQEINKLFLQLLRKRGLEYVSDIVSTHLPGGLPGGVTHPAEQLPETPGPPS